MAELISDLELDGIRVDARQTISEGTCTIERRDEIERSDVAADGSLTTTRTVLHTDIPCNFSPILARRDRFDEFAEALVFTRQYRVKVAWDVDDVRIGDYVTITTTADPQADGREFVVRDVVLSENNSVRIITVQDSEE